MPKNQIVCNSNIFYIIILVYFIYIIISIPNMYVILYFIILNDLSLSI